MISSGLKSLVKRPKMRGFYKLYMKRRELSGEYESTWQEIQSQYIKSLGSVSYGVSDVRAGLYKYSGLKLELANLDSYFGATTDNRSFFSGKLSIYRTLLRLDAGYLDDTDIQIPTSSTIFLGMIGEGFEWTDAGTVEVDADHISKIFDEFPASQVSGLGTAQSASDIVAKVRDYTDTRGNYIFKKFVPLWNIETTTNSYDIATTTALQGKSVWDMFRDLAVAENKYIFVDRNGQFNFRSQATTSTVIWHLSGANDTDNTYGKNIVGQINRDERIQDVYNRVRIQYADGDTTTSFLTKEETWYWGDSSSSFIYGTRTYTYKNLWLSAATASTVADTIYNRYKDPITIVQIRTKYLPEIEIDDRVTVTHKNGVMLGQSLYGSALYSNSTPAADFYGHYGTYNSGNFEFNAANYFVRSVNHNLKDYTTLLSMEAE